MGVTLEDLLQTTGISQEPEGQEKTASDESTDLVSALRKCASDETVGVTEAARDELIEKTAEIFIIQSTLAEISQVINAETSDKDIEKTAAFFKVAMDKGYSSEEISSFLKEAGPIDWIARKASGALLSARRPFGRASFRYANKVDAHENRLLMDHLVNSSSKSREKYLNTIKAKMGPERLSDKLRDIELSGHKLDTAVKKHIINTSKDKHVKSYSITGPGGKQYSISEAAAKKYGKPALAVAGGAAGYKALSGGGGGGSGNKSGKKVVVL